MITKNFKAALSVMLNSGDSNGRIEVKDFSGNTRYLAPYYTSSEFPTKHDTTVRISSNLNQSGIFLGSGNTPATENDYALETPIVTGISASTPVEVYNVDADNNPYRELTISLNNTTASDIVVREVAYVQCNRGAYTLGGNVVILGYYMYDRTILDTPLTVPANGVSVLRYELKSIIS